jgi:hypothetical protein
MSFNRFSVWGFKKTKASDAKAIIHDGLHSYDEAFQKEYFTLRNPRVKNTRSPYPKPKSYSGPI